MTEIIFFETWNTQIYFRIFAIGIIFLLLDVSFCTLNDRFKLFMWKPKAPRSVRQFYETILICVGIIGMIVCSHHNRQPDKKVLLVLTNESMSFPRQKTTIPWSSIKSINLEFYRVKTRRGHRDLLKLCLVEVITLKKRYIDIEPIGFYGLSGYMNFLTEVRKVYKGPMIRENNSGQVETLLPG